MKALTLPQQRMRERGLTSVQVARKMNAGRRLSKRQLETRARTVARVLREGNCGALYARRLGHVLGLNAHILELPRQCWPAIWRDTSGHDRVPQPALVCSGQESTTSVGGSNQGERASASPGSHRRPSPTRLEILRLVP